MIWESEEVKQLGWKVINDNPVEFKELIEGKYNIAFLEDDSAKTQNGMIIHGMCSLVPSKYKWTCDYDFTITFYQANNFGFTEKQYEILMYHELLHAGLDKGKPYIVPHDLSDFKKVVDEFGTNWSETEGMTDD